MSLRNPENKEDQAQLTKRYHHISVDKLANAFEQQFMQGLPEFGQYTQKDTQVTPEIFGSKSEQYGIYNSKSNTFAQAQSEILNKGTKEEKLKRDQLLQKLSQEDLSQISIFKSKVRYSKLRKDIQDCETIVVYINFFWMIAIGACSFIIAALDVILNDSPMIIDICFKYQNW